LKILRLRIPQGSKLLKQSPPELLIDIPLLPAGFWLAAERDAAEHLTTVQCFGEERVAEQRRRAAESQETQAELPAP